MFRFKVTLRGITPHVWRRIEVPASYSLWDLHVAIQDAMGWKDYHLHVFRFGKARGRVVEVGIPNDDAFEGEPPILPGWEEPLRAYFQQPGTTVEYEYDFGDSWHHDVRFEGIVPRVKGLEYPRCTGGARACPPEDCGGVHGYEELLSVLQDRGHPEFESTMEWLGGHLDPDAFDAGRVTFDDPRRRWKFAFGSGKR